MPGGLLDFAPHRLARLLPNPATNPLAPPASIAAPDRARHMEYQQIAALPTQLPQAGTRLSAFASALALQSASVAQPHRPPVPIKGLPNA